MPRAAHAGPAAAQRPGTRPGAPAGTAPSEDKQVSEAAFLKSLDKQRATAAAAAKTARRTGFPDDHEILEKLEIPVGQSKTFNAAVSAIKFSFAKDDANRPAFRFQYVVVSDNMRYNGVQLSNYYILEAQAPTDKWKGRTLEEAQAELFGEFQGLGEDTSGWAADPRVNPLATAVQVAKEHTAAKTPITLTVQHWESKDKQKTGMRVTVKGPIADADNSDLVTDEEVAQTEATDSFDPNQWLNAIVDFKDLEGKPIKGQIESFVDDTYSHVVIVDQNNELWEGEYAVDFNTVEWSDDQTWA